MTDYSNLSYLYVFLQSSSLEVPFYCFGLRSAVPVTQSRTEPERFFFFLFAVTLMNSVTHPMVIFGILNMQLTFLNGVLVAEAFAILSETIFFIWLLRANFNRAFVVATIANLVSWQLGPILTYLLFSN